MNEKIKAIIENAAYALKDEFSAIDANALKRQKDVLDAFRTHNVGQRHFAPTNGCFQGTERYISRYLDKAFTVAAPRGTGKKNARAAAPAAGRAGSGCGRKV